MAEEKVTIADVLHAVVERTFYGAGQDDFAARAHEAIDAEYKPTKATKEGSK